MYFEKEVVVYNFVKKLVVDNFFLDIRGERTSQIIIIVDVTRNSFEISVPTDVTWIFFSLPECDMEVEPPLSLTHTVASTKS